MVCTRYCQKHAGVWKETRTIPESLVHAWFLHALHFHSEGVRFPTQNSRRTRDSNCLQKSLRPCVRVSVRDSKCNPKPKTMQPQRAEILSVSNPSQAIELPPSSTNQFSKKSTPHSPLDPQFMSPCPSHTHIPQIITLWRTRR